MLRKMMIALFACASVAMLAPDAASARGGGLVAAAVVSTAAAVAVSGGGFRGGGFRGGGMGMGGGGFRAAAIGGGGFRSAAIGGGGFRSIAFAGPDSVAVFAVNDCRGINGDFRYAGRRSASVSGFGLLRRLRLL